MAFAFEKMNRCQFALLISFLICSTYASAPPDWYPVFAMVFPSGFKMNTVGNPRTSKSPNLVIINQAVIYKNKKTSHREVL